MVVPKLLFKNASRGRIFPPGQDLEGRYLVWSVSHYTPQGFQCTIQINGSDPDPQRWAFMSYDLRKSIRCLLTHVRQYVKHYAVEYKDRYGNSIEVVPKLSYGLTLSYYPNGDDPYGLE